MKRLISWLLALVMIFSCLSMSAISAFAVEVETENGESDFDVDFGELLPGYSADNRLTVAWTWNMTYTEAVAQVTVPAGKTMYFEYQGDPSFALFVNGAEYEFTAAQGRTDTNKFQITNSTEAEVTYDLGLKQPIGSFNNPKVIEDMSWYYGEVSQAVGDSDGYTYIYTAAETGTVTLYFNAEYDDEGNVIEGAIRDIMVQNLNTSVQKTLLQDGIDNYGLELQIPVEEGQQLMIVTSYVKDAEGNMYPAGTYSWTGNFSYPAGSEQNPITIEWEWDDEYANATASVEVTADDTYFNGYAGMILTANGTEIAQENGVFVLDAGTYKLALATPVGAYNNPEVIENIDGYTDSNSLAEGGSYSYIWTATEAGTVTLDVTAGANIVVDQITGISEDGWPISVQHELATVEYDDNWNATWVVAENLTIEVEAGQQLKIQVQGLTDWATWTTPAIDYTLTGAFESAAVPAPKYNLATSGYGLSLDAELIVSAKIQVADLKDDPNATIKIQFINDVTEMKLADYIAENGIDSKNRIVVKQSVKSFWMTHLVTVTIADGDGNVADYTDFWGEVSTGSYSFGAEDYVKTLSLGSSETTINAVRALLTYGACSQLYFSKSGTANITEELATEILTRNGYEAYDISGFTRDMLNQETTGKGDSFDGISIRGGTPDLAAAIFMKVQFNASSLKSEADMANYTYKLSYMAGDVLMEEDLEPTFDASRKRLVFMVDRIPAMFFDTMYEITITKNTGESYTGSTSILTYLGLAYDNAGSDVELVNLVQAMYYYNQAANAHFGK